MAENRKLLTKEEQYNKILQTANQINEKYHFPKSVSEIISQVEEEYMYSFSFVNQKRQLFRERLRLYSEQQKQKDKISANSLYNFIQTLL